MNNDMAEKISIFSEPEKIDAVIRTRLEQFPRNGGKTSTRKVAWNEDEIELIDAVILQYITEQGLSRERTAHQIMDRWGIALSTARRYVKECIGRMAEKVTAENDHMREIWLERVESILANSIEGQQKDAALKALDMLAKSFGLYRENVQISGGEEPIKFDFQ